MAAVAERVAYHTTVREMASEEQPRERLEKYGARSLQTAELLAILLRVGVRGENVVELAARLLRQYGGLHGLLTAEMPELRAEHGLGQAKATTLKAALELGRRFAVEAPQERPQITGPQDAVALVQWEMGYLKQEQLRVLCLDTKNYVVM
jgi:DNA repair protein RadC